MRNLCFAASLAATLWLGHPAEKFLQLTVALDTWIEVNAAPVVIAPGQIAEVKALGTSNAELTAAYTVANENPRGHAGVDVSFRLSAGDCVAGPAVITLRRTVDMGKASGRATIAVRESEGTELRSTLEWSKDGVEWQPAPSGVVAGSDRGLFRVRLTTQ